MTAEQLVADRMGLLRHMARRFERPGLDRGDLVGAAVLAVVRAARSRVVRDPDGLVIETAKRAMVNTRREHFRHLRRVAAYDASRPSGRQAPAQERALLRKEVIDAVRGLPPSPAERSVLEAVLRDDTISSGGRNRRRASQAYRRLIRRARAALQIEVPVHDWRAENGGDRAPIGRDHAR